MQDFRLDPECVPSHYDIDLDFNMQTFHYTGKMKIFLHFLSPKSSFKIHSKSPVQILSIKDHQGLVLNFESRPFEMIQIFLHELTSGESCFEIEFEADVGRDCKGCFVTRSENKRLISEGRVMVTTDFEPTLARQALPCFDEPMFKATFDLIIKAGDWTVISNMPGELDENSGKWKFDRSPLMSVYLLHWTICRHQKLSVYSGETEISVYSDHPEHTKKSLEIAKDSLAYFTSEFQEAYPLPKLDLIAVYSNFYSDMSSGAMENWGSITFLEDILYKLPEDALNKVIRHFRTIAHEISHMWFGNLVTLKWWNDLWLNEGFARFMEFRCLQSIRPELNPWEQFASEVLYQGLLYDHPVNRSHPVEIENIGPENISTFFDSISYLKGASLLRMLEDVMGVNFSRAVSHYISLYKWKNVESEEFLDCMQNFTEYNIKDMMKTWTKQSGFPLIFCEKQENNTFLISQRPFDKRHSASWVIPVRFQTSTGESGLFTLDQKEILLPFTANWVHLNSGVTGFYRVFYKNCSDLFISAKSLTALDRFGLLHDSCAFFQEKMIDIQNFLFIIESLIPENKFFICELMYSLSFPSEDLEIQERFEKMMFKNSIALMDTFRIASSSQGSEAAQLQDFYIPSILKYWRKIHEKIKANDSEEFEESEEKIDDEDLNFFRKFAKIAFEESNDKKLLTDVLSLSYFGEDQWSEQVFEDLKSGFEIRANVFWGIDQLVILVVAEAGNEEDFFYVQKLVGLVKYYFQLKNGNDVEYLKKELTGVLNRVEDQEISEMIEQLLLDN